MSDDTFTVRGATVIDGSGAPGVKEDVVVVDGKIAEVGKLIKGNERGKIVDATDLTLSPGFIDMHAHSDLAVLTDKQHLAKVTQGVTMEVVGQDGLSYVPSNPETLLELREQLFSWNADPSDLKWDFHSVSEYLSRVDKGSAVSCNHSVTNCVSFVCARVCVCVCV